MPIEQGANWDDALGRIEGSKWYLDAFRGEHCADAADHCRPWLDERASVAARLHPGFMYDFIAHYRLERYQVAKRDEAVSFQPLTSSRGSHRAEKATRERVDDLIRVDQEYRQRVPPRETSIRFAMGESGAHPRSGTRPLTAAWCLRKLGIHTSSSMMIGASGAVGSLNSRSEERLTVWRVGRGSRRV